jgi:2-polyprenyl-6-methoxyphenol hydroxylase-like FAD-dependent oxidoreductase
VAYATDLTDAQCRLVGDLFDPPGRRGAPARIPRRGMVNTILYQAHTGCQWRYLPFGCEVVGFAQDDSAVDVELSGDTSLRAKYLVGCDGGRSLIRKAAGIDFPGWDPSTSFLIAEVEMDEGPEFGIRHDSVGTHALNRREDREPVRVVLTERHLEHTGDPSMGELREALVAVYGTGLRASQRQLDLQVH